MALISLVRPLLSPRDFNGYPLNLLILASALRATGHVVEIKDFDLSKEIDPTWTGGGFARRAAIDVLASHPDFVGITALCSNYVIALDLAGELKRLAPEVHITFGGPHVSLCARETLERYPSVDTAVIGEGEVTYPELIRAIEERVDLATILGVAFRSGDEVHVTPHRPLLPDLNLSPRPSYDLVDIPGYLGLAEQPYMELYAGSGCPFTCSFCSTSIVWERKYRTMTPKRIVDEMEELSSTYGVKAFNLIHDNLTTRRQYVVEIARSIRERGLDIRWGFSSRIDTIDLDTIREVAASGCDYVFFGVESGSSKIQRTMRKRLKLERVEQIVSGCVDNGIAPATSFILGFPEEDGDDVAETIRLAFRCRTMGARRTFISLLSAYTGTPVMKEQFETLYFDRHTANTTMTAFLEEHHYAVINADKFIFSNYYSIDYSSGDLDAGDYLDLVDFYTICLFRYRFTFDYLLNSLRVDPVALFAGLRSRIAGLSIDQRNQLALSLTAPDIRPSVGSEHGAFADALMAFDEALWISGTTPAGAVLFDAPILLTMVGRRSSVRPDTAVNHYLLAGGGEKVRVSELPAELSRLYELQGVVAIRPAAPECDEGTRRTGAQDPGVRRRPVLGAHDFAYGG